MRMVNPKRRYFAEQTFNSHSQPCRKLVSHTHGVNGPGSGSQIEKKQATQSTSRRTRQMKRLFSAALLVTVFCSILASALQEQATPANPRLAPSDKTAAASADMPDEQ